MNKADKILNQRREAGRLGGLTKTDDTKKRGFGSKTPEELSEIGRKAAQARWRKYESDQGTEGKLES
jgi:hypothetical protein